MSEGGVIGSQAGITAHLHELRQDARVAEDVPDDRSGAQVFVLVHHSFEVKRDRRARPIADGAQR